MTGEELKRTLSRGGSVFGTLLTAAHPVRWMWMFRQLGLDFAVIDTEHAAVSRPQMADLAAALTLVGVAPLVRVSKADPAEVAKALDAGAHGVLVPYCETREAVTDCVRAARFAPIKGRRLAEHFAGKPLPPRTLKALQRENRGNVVVIGIESVSAVENLAALLDAGDPVDAVFVGTGDLSFSLGHPGEVEHPSVVSAFKRVLRACEERSIPAGIWPLPARLAAAWRRRGMRFVLHSADHDAMFEGFRRDFELLKRASRPRR